MISNRIGDGRLVAVKAREVESILEIASQAFKDPIVSDRSIDEFDRWMLGYALDLRRQQIVHDTNFPRAVGEKPQHEVRADKTGATYHQHFVVFETCHAGFGAARWLWTSVTPCRSYHCSMRWTVSPNGVRARHPRTSQVRDGSGTTTGTSSGPAGTTFTSRSGASPRRARVAS